MKVIKVMIALVDLLYLANKIIRRSIIKVKIDIFWQKKMAWTNIINTHKLWQSLKITYTH